ncbi:putative transmembrane protein [Rhodopirellula islandica]|uniref:Transmembrane protein n=1 Tax=Rhodopirellula islandica TaxID=595434 RepID=A0A0J1B3S3_RHOIS|nr:cytochrome c assembly protein [Rhodopirellula islandica]KLU01268.1 putative transmembrane protein [Rhodopirellula islandica]
MELLRQISVTCFSASYLVVLVLEALRFLGRVPGRGLAVVVMMGLGIFTHVTYLTLRAASISNEANIGRLATWTDWSLMVALGLAIAFFAFYLRRPDTVIGLFFLPAILAMIALSRAVSNLPAFERNEAVEVWRGVHGVSMMLGSAAVLVGFLAGAMYLVQSWRLKRKQAGSSLRLPTLETLQNLNRSCLVISTASVGVGLVSGVVMNWNRLGMIPWTDGGIILSGVLFLWLVTATVVEYIYAPASRGRKIAYLTLASFGFLVLAMTGVLSSSHGADQSNAPVQPSKQDVDASSESLDNEAAMETIVPRGQS